jgi:[ribosomal protein S5]-alanine N-acetyltransferase
MINGSTLNSLAFSTTRLEVARVNDNRLSEWALSEFLSDIVSLLSPSVVESLPPYFHNIKTNSDADVWRMKMISESHLLSVKKQRSNTVIGFVFLYESDNESAHLEYLLAESIWHQGYGSELLLGLLNACRDHKLVNTLIGGVEKSNVASAKLLEKVGFEATKEGDNGVIFYECRLY